MIKKEHPMMDKKRIIYYFFLITITIILNTQTIHAANTTILPPFPTNPQPTTIDISNVVVQENIKTRMEIKQYCDQKIATMIETVKTQGQSFIGQNFAEFDRRIHALATTLFIKAIIATFTTILLAQLVYYIIKRKIEKKHLPRATYFKEIPLSPTQAGIIPTQIQPEITPPMPPRTDTRELPTFPELRQPILLSPKEKEKIIKEQEEIDKKKKKEAEKKLAKLIDEHNKNRKQHTKLKKKLQKPEQTEEQLTKEHEELQKQIEQLSKEFQIPI